MLYSTLWANKRIAFQKIWDLCKKKEAVSRNPCGIKMWNTINLCRLGDSTRYVSVCIVRDVYHNMFIGSPVHGSKTGILNPIVFHKIPTVEFESIGKKSLKSKGNIWWSLVISDWERMALIKLLVQNFC